MKNTITLMEMYEASVHNAALQIARNCFTSGADFDTNMCDDVCKKLDLIGVDKRNFYKNNI